MQPRLLLAATILTGITQAFAQSDAPGAFVAEIRSYRLHGGAQGYSGFDGSILKIETALQRGVFPVEERGGLTIGDLAIGVRDGEITWNGQPEPPKSSVLIANTTVEGRFGEDVVVRTLDTFAPQYFEQIDPNNWQLFRLRRMDEWTGFVATLRVDTPATHPNRRLPADAIFPNLSVRVAIPEGREPFRETALEIGRPILFTDEFDNQPTTRPNEWLAFLTVTRDNGSLVTLLRIRGAAVADAAQDSALAPNGFLFESRVYEITGSLQENSPRSVLAHSIDGPSVKMLLEPVLHDFPEIDGDWDGEQTAAALQAFLGGVPRDGKVSLLSAPRMTIQPNPDTRYKLVLIDRSADSSNPVTRSPSLSPLVGDWLARMGVSRDWLAKAETGVVKFGIIADLRSEALSYRTADSDDKVNGYMEYAGFLFGVLARTVQDGAFSVQFAFEDRRLPKNHRLVFPSLEAAKALATSTAFTSTYQSKPGDVIPFLYSSSEKKHMLILVRVTNMEVN